jgi:uncharacterized protein YggE
MNSSISISVRSMLIAAALAVAVVIAYLLGTAAQGGTPAQAATPPATAPQPGRTITMTGSGEATGVPDEMTFKLSVGSTAGDVSTAMDQASGKMKQAVASLRKNGVEKKDTQTTGLSIDPTYHYYNNQPPVLTGYRVRQSMVVTVRSLRNAGKALSATVAAGGNSARISDLNLQIGDVDNLLGQARDKAVGEATTKAKQYAEATGQHLGAVLTIREVRAAPAQPQGYAIRAPAMDALKGAVVPIQAGSEKLGVEVAVVWSLR